MKIIAFVSALVLGASISGIAEAQTRRPAAVNYGYVFAEYDYYSGAGSSLNGGGVGLGWRFSRYFGVQAGGQYSRKSGVDFTNGYIEGLLILPVSPRFAVHGSIGGAYLNQSVSTTVLGTPITVSSSQSGYRAGAGAEYWLTPQWSVRASYHRQNTFAVLDNISAGIGFRF